MAVVALGSISGSPGVTRLTIGLAAAWPDARRRVVIEADDAGGRLGAELGVGAEPGLMALALAARAHPLTADELLTRGAARTADWFVVPAPPSGEQAMSALTHAAGSLAEVVAGAVDDVWIVDTGRLSTRAASLPFARVADPVLLVTAGTFPALQLVAHRVDALRRAGCPVTVVLVEPTSWSAAEVCDFVGADIAAVIPHVSTSDHRVGSMRGSAWRSWWSAVGRLADWCATRHPPTPLVATATEGSS